MELSQNGTFSGHSDSEMQNTSISPTTIKPAAMKHLLKKWSMWKNTPKMPQKSTCVAASRRNNTPKSKMSPRALQVSKEHSSNLYPHLWFPYYHHPQEAQHISELVLHLEDLCPNILHLWFLRNRARRASRPPARASNNQDQVQCRYNRR